MLPFAHGRQSHNLLELFKYIPENPEPSELLLEESRASKPPKPLLVEGLVLTA